MLGILKEDQMIIKKIIIILSTFFLLTNLLYAQYDNLVEFQVNSNTEGTDYYPSVAALKNGGLHKIALLLLGLVFVPYYIIFLYPDIPDIVLSGSVFLYLGISIVALALAFGMKQTFSPKLFYIIGIALIVFSDTLISFNEFLQYRTFNKLILPTYYLAHISITISLFIRRIRS